jgi:MFS family permease
MLFRLMRTDRKNFTLGVVHETLWGFGLGLVHPYTILPLAWLDLGGSQSWAGTLPGLMMLGMNAPQAFAAYLFPPRYTEPRNAARLNAVALVGPVIAALALWLLAGVTPLKRALFLGGFLLFHVGIGFVVPHWMASMARSIPPPMRGRFFGTCFFFSNGVGVLSGFLAAAWAAKGGVEWGYTLCAGLSVPFFLASLAVLTRIRPVLGPPQPARERDLGRYLASLTREWWVHRPLKALAFVTLAWFMAGAVGNFLTVYVKEVLATDKRWFMLFTPAMSAGTMAGTLALGHLCDARGPRYALQVGFSMILVSLLGVAVLPAGPWQSVPFFAAGFGGAMFVVMMVVVLKSAGEKRNTFLTGFLNSLMAPFSFGVPLVWAWGIAEWGYGAAFVVSGLVGAAGMAWVARDRLLDRAVGRR